MKPFGRNPILEEMAQEPRGEVLGTITGPTTDPTPQGPSASWTGPSGDNIDLNESPPPWELSGGEMDDSDAARFVTVPTNWTLRWINPRLLESEGWRDWQPVLASHPQVTVKVALMVGVDGNIRRGGQTGDILAWMYTSWVESKRERLAQKTRRATDAAAAKQAQLHEELMRGSHGQVRVDGARHPTHTIADGRSMNRD